MQPFKDFFTAYAAASLGDDPHAIASFYAETFMVAAPVGAAAYRNDDKFIDWLNGVIRFNKDVGMQEMNPANVETSAMGEHYTLARVTWKASFDRTVNQPIAFDISYILQHTPAGVKIIGYVSHDDQETVMKKYGLL